MFTLYPSNKLEHLSYLLHAVMGNSKASILQAKTVLVESTGMQHWLNLQIAEHAGISMNIDYPMPTRYVWQICRDILGHDKVPLQSTYKREVMLWRIERLLDSEDFKKQQFDADLVSYWQEESLAKAEFKRVNLSRLIADTLEQYLMFRPEWLLAWEKGQSIVNAQGSADGENKVALSHEVWQRWIWQELAKQEPFHPVRLQLLALAQLEEKQHLLPQEVYFFAINTMAPQTLSFFNQVAKYTQIHFFHLNPCVDYWGDAVSDSAVAKQLKQGKIDAWVDQQSINPLLRNLGQQGKDLFNLLSQASHYEISAFETQYPGTNEEISLLNKIQSNILHGDGADQPNAEHPIVIKGCEAGSEAVTEQVTEKNNADDSVIVRSCHSSLREIQVLHDYLIQQFSQDPSLSPRDVLVMCPAIENYSPYIEAVFGRSVSELNNEEKQRIPCTIADRNPLDAEPLVAAFMQLLSLPDSRFNVNEFLGFLHIPAVMNKYDIQGSELDLFAHWIQQANIYWGLDAEHKSSILGIDTATGTFTWQWGILRLIEGFSHADNNLIIDDELLALNEVEGQLAVSFGKLMQLLERLANYGDSLQVGRSMSEWKAYLFTMRDDLFAASPNEQYASHTITSTLGQFFEHYEMSFVHQNAPTNDKLSERTWSYQTIRQALQHAFTSPDSQNQFMTGQVTFCSMMPMRSIPFKIIAVLGLNDGEFPRQTSHVDMDLITHLGRQLGDRSRRGDDRYLFLEAILSARRSLYLSYQGKGIKDNKNREPSLVLSELLAYLKKQFQFDNMIQQPLHPFSINSFQHKAVSGVQQNFDKGWHRLMSSLQTSAVDYDNLPSQSIDETVQGQRVSLDKLIQFFKKPIEFYAKNVQGLRLDDIHPSLSDVEPFVESGLDVYSLVTSFTNCFIECEQAGLPQDLQLRNINDLKQQYLLCGALPENHRSEVLISDSLEQSSMLMQTLAPLVSDAHLSGQLLIGNTELDYDFTVGKSGGVVAYHPNGNSFRHLIASWIQHLVVCAHPSSHASKQVCEAPKGCFISLNRSKTSASVTLKVTYFVPIDKDRATQQLANMLDIYYRGINTPLLVMPDLAETLIRNITADKEFDPLVADHCSYFEHPEIAARWETVFNNPFSPPPFVQDKYFIHYFPYQVQLDKGAIRDMLSVYQCLKSCSVIEKAKKARGK